MQSRIDRLEGLVLSLMTNGAHSAGPSAAGNLLTTANASPEEGPPAREDDEMTRDDSDGEESDVDRVTNSFGIMKVEANKSMYYGDAHWATFLADIKEVRNYFTEHHKQLEDQSAKVAATKIVDASDAPAFLLGRPPPVDQQSLLSALPSRAIADKLVSRYFNCSDPAVHIIHGPSFRAEYEAHWANPTNTQVGWLGKLYAILCLAMQSYHRADEEPAEYMGNSMRIANMYRKGTVDCLVQANFTKPGSTTLETLILHLQGEYSRSRDADVGVWILAGMIVRLAMRMGYHRDPRPYPGITPFQGEMRRRVWTLLRQMDILFSFQVGLSCMVRSMDCDTALPSNLYDDEFSEEMTHHPPSRSATEPTPVSYMIANARTSFAFGDVVELVQSIKPVSRPSYYEEVMRLDYELRNLRESIPPHLRMRPMEDSVMEPANLIMQRFNLELLYLKAQCVLHRKFLGRARTNPRYAHSRRTCVDASMELLGHQATLHHEARPKGRLRNVRWFISSLTSHDFFLAGMVVCLDLYHGSNRKAPGHSPEAADGPDTDRRMEMVQALQRSKDIWDELKDQSMEAYKANELMSVMLAKLKTHSGKGQEAAAAVSMATNDKMLSNFPPDICKPEHSAAMTLGLLSSGGLTPHSGPSMERINSPTAATPSFNQFVGTTPAATYASDMNISNSLNSPLAGGAAPFTFLAPSSGMLDMPANLDWDAWDSYVQGAPLDPANQFWPASMDLPADMGNNERTMGDQSQAQQQRQQQPQPAGTSYGGGEGVFMGVNTPPDNTIL
ncbi:MAG: hypothetical protein M1817_002438 [Caeruleum heppii]|nr:MAG: hypothetical protein M1817_002438 [Caeruleum heppii]